MGEITIKAEGFSPDNNRVCNKCGCHFKAKPGEEKCPNCGSKMLLAIVGYAPIAGGGGNWSGKEG